MSLLLGAEPLTASAQPRPIGQAGFDQIRVLINEKAERTLAQRKIGSRLLRLIKRYRDDPMFDAVPRLRPGVRVEPDGMLLVDIRANIDPGLLARIKALGGEVVDSHPRYQAIRARMPVEAVEELAKMRQVLSIRPADRAITRKINTSEGDVAHGADLARGTFGIDGAGVKTCVLSDAVDSLASLQSSGDLPAVTILAGQAGRGGSEGTAMLEIIHDLAPGASLFFATAFGGQARFAQNILDLRSVHDCDVLVDDVFYLAEPALQDGIIAQAVNDVIDDGALYFSAAGNSGNRNDGTSGTWEGDYNPTALPAPLAGLAASAHDFGGGDNFNTITKDSPFGFGLYWADPQGGSSNDYDLYLLDSSGTSVLAASTDTQSGTQDPFEFITSENFNDTNTRLVVVLSSGNNRFIHLATFRGELMKATNGEIKGHSAAADAYSVAAVDVDTAGGSVFTGGAANPVETFSSDGPRRMFFQAGGTPYTPGNFSSSGGIVRQKPDITAADGVSTATPGFNPFFGTSAAAPHAAAMATLMLDNDPTLTNGEVDAVFESTALDIEAIGIDRDSGYGIITNKVFEMVAIPIAKKDRQTDSLKTGGEQWFALNSTETQKLSIQTNGFSGDTTLALFTGSDPGNASLIAEDDDSGPEQFSNIRQSVNAGPHLIRVAGDTDVDPYFLRLMSDQDILDFTDTAGHFARREIRVLSTAGITVGCGAGLYCPRDLATRAELAIILVRAIQGGNHVPPAATGNVFDDVAANSFGANFIEEFSTLGITSGCGNNNYCPDAPVTREQMAVFLLRAWFGAAHIPPQATPVELQQFDDIAGSFARDWIVELVEEGITGGCGNNNFCPTDPVTRGQMAAFIQRTFDLDVDL